MTRSFIARYVSPWAIRRDKVEQQRVAALRHRDGENCRRCRRPIRFDMPRGHDKGPTVEEVGPNLSGDPRSIDALCLCHVRCHAAGADNTGEVTERIRRKSEAELLSKSRRAPSRRSRKA
ncbi:MAG: hypothetical protein ACM3ZV_03690 [Bacillota bacterium]